MCHWILTADCEAIVKGYEAEISNNGVLSSPALYPILHEKEERVIRLAEVDGLRTAKEQRSETTLIATLPSISILQL